MPPARIPRAVAAILLVSGSVAFVACGSGASTSSSPPPPSPTWAHAVTNDAPGGPKTVLFGDPKHPGKLDIDLQGLLSEATVTSGNPSPSLATGKTGHHVFTVAVHIVNNGSVTFTGNILTGTWVDTTTNQVSFASPLAVGNGPAMPSGVVTIKPGASLLGWLAFVVPNDRVVSRIVVDPNGPYSDQASWWIVPPMIHVTPPADSATPTTRP